MRKILLLTSMLVVLTTLFFGCGPMRVVTKMDQVFEKDVISLDIPDIETIKKEGIKKEFPYTTYDHLWDSISLILIQRGIIVSSSKDSGIFTIIPSQNFAKKKLSFRPLGYFLYGSPPAVIYVMGDKEKDEKSAKETEKKEKPIRVFYYCMEHLYKPVIAKNEKYIELPDKAKKELIAKEFYDRLSTQVYAYEKWKYLFKERQVISPD